MKYFTLNRVFAAYLVIFIGIISGLLPRETALYTTGVLIAWFLLAPLKDATLFFVRSVPLFIAIPLTTSYDNLNMWRPLAVVLILRLLVDRQTWQQLREFLDLRKHPTFHRLLILFILAALSLIGAAYLKVGIIRTIYFLNLLMAPVVVWSLLRRNIITAKEVITNIAIPTMIVIIAGYLQLASTYLMDIYQFMHLWGEGIQLRQFGTQWSYIAVHLGNTWLAYYGPQLSLRVFSLFTDSHTFPIFVLFGLPALVAWARGRSRWAQLWIPAGLLIVILSGTRGIWAAAIPTAVGAAYLAWRHQPFRLWAKYLGLFFLLFAIAWPIFISPQFLVGKTGNLFTNRLKSIVDFGETSNAQRLLIWKSSLTSIVHHPWLGVGIGNFPVVLGQNIELAKAGSTAHNVYLHVAAEMGIPAVLEFMILLGGIIFAAWRWSKTAHEQEAAYATGMVITLSWVFIYLLTDAALFDERAFLAFGIAVALIISHGSKVPATR